MKEEKCGININNTATKCKIYFNGLIDRLLFVYNIQWAMEAK